MFDAYHAPRPLVPFNGGRGEYIGTSSFSRKQGDLAELSTLEERSSQVRMRSLIFLILEKLLGCKTSSTNNESSHLATAVFLAFPDSAPYH